MLCNKVFLNNTFASFPLTDNAQSSLKLQDLFSSLYSLKKEKHIYKTLSILNFQSDSSILDSQLVIIQDAICFSTVYLEQIKIMKIGLILKNLSYTSKHITLWNNQIRKLTPISVRLHSLKCFQRFFFGTDFRSSSTSHTRNSVITLQIQHLFDLKQYDQSECLIFFTRLEYKFSKLFEFSLIALFPKIKSVLKG